MTPKERTLLSVLVVAAMLRTLFFLGAFPLFNNVDEAFHIDLVIKRTMGLPIRPHEPIGEATRDLELRYATGLGVEGREIRFYWSPEYVDPRLPPGVATLPFWKASETVQSAFEARAKAMWPTGPNTQAFEPPLYYAIAACWARLGRALGFGEAGLLYWIRAMDAVIVGGLVLLAAAFGRLCDPASRAFRLGMPLLVAAIPQKALYSITNDALSPLVGGLAACAGLRLLVSERARARDALAGGVAIGLGILTKLTNVLLIAMLPLIVAFRFRRDGLAGAGRAAGFLVGAIALPVVLGESSRDHRRFSRGPRPRPSVDVSSAGVARRYPILTAGGAWFFVSQLLTTFWRGELIWHGVPLALPVMDWVYVILSLALLGAAGLRLLREPRPPVRGASLTASRSPARSCSVGFRELEFGNSYYPSRATPFFVSGRLTARHRPRPFRRRSRARSNRFGGRGDGRPRLRDGRHGDGAHAGQRSDPEPIQLVSSALTGTELGMARPAETVPGVDQDAAARPGSPCRPRRA